MSGLQFTEEAAQQLETLYMTRDVVAQRTATLEKMCLVEGEHAIDMGCGPGYLCEAIGDKVGNCGRVVGIDVSPDLIAYAEQRNQRPWLTYRVGDATLVEEADGVFDLVACTQVAEYIPDVDKAISEAFRVLKPGGRAVFVATDWDAVIWHSDNPARMNAVMQTWEAHCAHPQLPRSISERLRKAGFNVDGASVFPILNLDWGDDTYSKGMTALIRDFVAGQKRLSQRDLRDWEEELPRLSGEGRYFFSSIRFIFQASRPRELSD